MSVVRVQIGGIQMQEEISHILSSMKFYQETYPEDACIIVTDLEKVIGYLPGRAIDLKMPIGTPIEKFTGTVTERALTQKKRLREERGSEDFGIAYVATSSPIRTNDGAVAGVLTTVVSNKRFDTLRDGAAELVAMIQELSASADELTKGSQQIAEQVQDSSDVTGQMTERVQDTVHISNFVADVASQSHILGLNATIEAARAGDAGRGFAVVASEIQKMANESKKASGNIRTGLEQLMRGIAQLNENATTIAAASQEHAAGVEEMRAVFEHISRVAEELLSNAQVETTDSH